MANKGFFDEFVTALRAGTVWSLAELLPDPDPILRRIGKSTQMYAEIRADAKVSACVESRKAGVLSMQWSLDNSGTADKATAAIDESLKYLDMPRILTELLDAFLYGFQPLEVLWEKRDGLILPRDVLGKPSEWFAFDSGNKLRFITRDNPLGIELPERKFLLARHHPSYANPYGSKILPKCFWPVTFKKGGWKWWVTFTEKYGMPLILGKVPRGTDVAEQDMLLETLEQLFQDACAVLPNDSQIELLQGGGSGAGAGQHQALIDQCNNEIALAIVGQTLSSEIGDSGSYAASKVHNDVRTEIVTSDKRMAERVIQQLVNWIYEVNWSGGKPPIFSLWSEHDVDKDLAQRDEILTRTGIKFSKNYYIKTYGFDLDDFEIAARESSKPTTAFNEFAEPSTKRQREKGKEEYDPSTAELDGRELSKAGKSLLKTVLNLLKEGTSLEEVLSKIDHLYPSLDTKDLHDLLARACFVAAVRGRNDR